MTYNDLKFMNHSDLSTYKNFKLISHSNQCDQIKIAKCPYKLPKNGFTRKFNDFDNFTKIA